MMNRRGRIFNALGLRVDTRETRETHRARTTRAIKKFAEIKIRLSYLAIKESTLPKRETLCER